MDAQAVLALPGLFVRAHTVAFASRRGLRMEVNLPLDSQCCRTGRWSGGRGVRQRLGMALALLLGVAGCSPKATEPTSCSFEAAPLPHPVVLLDRNTLPHTARMVRPNEEPGPRWEIPLDHGPVAFIPDLGVLLVAAYNTLNTLHLSTGMWQTGPTVSGGHGEVSKALTYKLSADGRDLAVFWDDNWPSSFGHVDIHRLGDDGAFSLVRTVMLEHTPRNAALYMHKGLLAWRTQGDNQVMAAQQWTLELAQGDAVLAYEATEPQRQANYSFAMDLHRVVVVTTMPATGSTPVSLAVRDGLVVAEQQGWAWPRFHKDGGVMDTALLEGPAGTPLRRWDPFGGTPLQDVGVPGNRLMWVDEQGMVLSNVDGTVETLRAWDQGGALLWLETTRTRSVSDLGAVDVGRHVFVTFDEGLPVMHAGGCHLDVGFPNSLGLVHMQRGQEVRMVSPQGWGRVAQHATVEVPAGGEPPILLNPGLVNPAATFHRMAQ